jgi:hypothetical protein
VLTLESVRPSTAIDVQLSVGYRSGDSNSTQYEIEARVYDINGQPIVGERVDFTGSRGSLSSSWGSTSSVGIAQTILTVTSTGDTTVTATARGIQAATSFLAQVGGSGASAMTAIKKFTLTGAVYGLAYSPDCSVLIAAGYGGGVKAWNTSDWSLKWSQTTTSGNASQVSISPNGQKVLVAQQDGTDIFDVSNGAYNCTATVPSGDESINATFTSDTTFNRTGKPTSTGISTMFRHSSLCLANGATIFTTPSADDWHPHAHMDYNAAKGWVALVSSGAFLYVNNASSGALVRQETMSSSSSRGHDADFNSDGSKLLALGYSTIKLFNTSNWSFSTYSPPSLGANGYFGAKLIDSDSKFAVAGTGKLEVLNLSGGATLRTADISGEGYEIDWCQSRAEMAVGTSAGTVEIFRPLAPPDTQGPVISVSVPSEGFSTNGTSIVTSGRVTDQTDVASF